MGGLGNGGKADVPENAQLNRAEGSEARAVERGRIHDLLFIAVCPVEEMIVQVMHAAAALERCR